GGAGERPRIWSTKVGVLSAVMRGDRPHVGHVFYKPFALVIVSKHAIAVTLRQPGNVLIHSRQDLGGHLFDLVTHQRFAANDIEILTVELEVLPHKLA